MINEKDIALIERYLAGELTHKEEESFEQRMSTDKEFAEEVKFYKDLEQASKAVGREEIKNKLNNIATSFKNSVNSQEEQNDEQAKVIKLPFNNRYLYAIAASIAVLIGIFLFYNTGKNDTGLMAINDPAIIKDFKNSFDDIEHKTKPIYSIREKVRGEITLKELDKREVDLIVKHVKEYDKYYLFTGDTLFLSLDLDKVDNIKLFESNDNIYVYAAGQYFRTNKSKKGVLTKLKKVDDDKSIRIIDNILSKD